MMKLKDTGLLPKKEKLGNLCLCKNPDVAWNNDKNVLICKVCNKHYRELTGNAVIDICGEIEVLERLDEGKVKQTLCNTGIGVPRNRQDIAHAICQKFGTEKIKET